MNQQELIKAFLEVVYENKHKAECDALIQLIKIKKFNLRTTKQRFDELRTKVKNLIDLDMGEDFYYTDDSNDRPYNIQKQTLFDSVKKKVGTVPNLIIDMCISDFIFYNV